MTGLEFSLHEPCLCSTDLVTACTVYETLPLSKEIGRYRYFMVQRFELCTLNKYSKALLNFCKRLVIYVLLAKANPIVTLPVFCNPGRRSCTVKNEEIMTFLAKKFRIRHT
jgi:hypothetical protein